LSGRAAAQLALRRRLGPSRRACSWRSKNPRRTRPPTTAGSRPDPRPRQLEPSAPRRRSPDRSRELRAPQLHAPTHTYTHTPYTRAIIRVAPWHLSPRGRRVHLATPEPSHYQPAASDGGPCAPPCAHPMGLAIFPSLKGSVTSRRPPARPIEWRFNSRAIIGSPPGTCAQEGQRVHQVTPAPSYTQVGARTGGPGAPPTLTIPPVGSRPGSHGRLFAPPPRPSKLDPTRPSSPPPPAFPLTIPPG